MVEHATVTKNQPLTGSVFERRIVRFFDVRQLMAQRYDHNLQFERITFGSDQVRGFRNTFSESRTQVIETIVKFVVREQIVDVENIVVLAEFVNAVSHLNHIFHVARYPRHEYSDFHQVAALSRRITTCDRHSHSSNDHLRNGDGPLPHN